MRSKQNAKKRKVVVAGKKLQLRAMQYHDINGSPNFQLLFFFFTAQHWALVSGVLFGEPEMFEQRIPAI